jgi:hypothetical protein
VKLGRKCEIGGDKVKLEDKVKFRGQSEIGWENLRRSEIKVEQSEIEKIKNELSSRSEIKVEKKLEELKLNIKVKAKSSNIEKKRNREFCDFRPSEIKFTSAHHHTHTLPHPLQLAQ